MERNTHTIVALLKTGDRFYRVNDKKKTVYQMVDRSAKVTFYRTYHQWAIDTRFLVKGNEVDSIAKFAKPLKGETEVIFLRNVASSPTIVQ